MSTHLEPGVGIKLQDRSIKIQEDQSGTWVDTFTVDKGGNVFVGGNLSYDPPPGTVLEMLMSQANGSTINVSSGSYETQNVTATQNLSTSYSVVNGSMLSYKPPPNTTRLQYQFHFHWYGTGSSGGMYHMTLYVDGTEVQDSRQTEIQRAASTTQQVGVFQYTLQIGGSEDIANGVISSWDTNKTIELRAREYHSSSWAVTLHHKNWWNGGGAPTLHRRPSLAITAVR